MKKRYFIFLFILIFIFNLSCQMHNVEIKKDDKYKLKISYKYFNYLTLKNVYNIKSPFTIISFEFIKNKTYSRFFDYLKYFDVKPFNIVKSRGLYYLNYLKINIEVLNDNLKNNLNINTILIFKNDYFYKPLSGKQIELLLNGQKSFINRKFIDTIVMQNKLKVIEFNKKTLIQIFFLSKKDFNIENSKFICELNGQIIFFDF